MMKPILAIAIAGIFAITSCQNHTTESTSKTTDTTVQEHAAPNTVKPKGPAPAWAPDMKPEMIAVIEKLTSYGDRPIEMLTAAEARNNHTPADAVMDLMKENSIPMPVLNVDTSGMDIPVTGGNIHLRIYTPKNISGPTPVIVYYHGGGFVIANLDVYDASAKTLSDKTGAIVVSVAYRLAPEHKFPVAHNDAFAAYQWIVKNAASIKGDPAKIAVAGESAGGNLAVNVAIMARDKNVQMPIHILAVYPVAGADMTTASYTKNADAKPLNKPMMEWFVKNYLNNMGEAKDPRINLVAANLKQLPTTTIITAGIDPLQNDGMNLAAQLKANGVEVTSKNYDGVTHEFFGMGAVVPEARDAMNFAVDEMKKALAK